MALSPQAGSRLADRISITPGTPLNLQIDKQILQLPSGLTVGGDASGAGPTGNTITTLQLLLNAIPIAEDGNVITREYHNALRDALIGIAGQLGVLVARQTVVTLAPTFFPTAPFANWSQSAGKAYLNLVSANLDEARASIRADLGAAGAASASVLARLQELAPVSTTLASMGISFPSDRVTTATEKANTAGTAILAATNTVENTNFATTLADAKAKTIEMVASVATVLGLATNALAIASVPGFQAALGPATQAIGLAGAAIGQAQLAADKIQSTETTLRQITDAQGDGKPTSCAGWLALQLPDGMSIRSMKAVGRKQGSLQRFQIDLVRQSILDATEVTLLSLDVKTSPTTFGEVVSTLPQDSGLQERDRQIDNTLYKYLIVAQASGVSGAFAQIDAIQITYSS